MRKLEKEELVLKEEGGGAEGVDLRKLLCREAVPRKTLLKLRQLMATAVGAALMLFYVLSRRLSQKAEEDNKDHGDGGDVSKSSRSVRQRRLSRRPAQASTTLLESIGTLSETLRFTYSETFRKWPIGDLAFGINYFMRKKKGAGFWGILTLGICVMVCILQGNLAVASVYAGSDSVQVKGDGIIVELYQDMIMEILSWLPVKDLLRFKCVSKGGTNLSPIQFPGLGFYKGDDNEDEEAVTIWGWKGFPNWFSVF
ncbi:hypothetical protein VIGAN_UM161200 [Vigna angularis var. angularis]|uniref:Uncharacterized protein n=1 Tax=Vigna angularis var. angularis TaxID=157739 RepID=A0A0S3TF05_PHAAN|nr:hypothetical protein VIGAN_UM161200 [Vigna angularis var. angularis]